ncbi:hypothetical protein, partial [Methylobacterium sp. J-092]|uniref:hypothetical protein n=1 Tax=Methylobacterium sp. J-092 TaxID=2836667 RepID=UPI001FB9C8C0
RDGRAARLISTNETHQSGGYIYPLRAEVEHPNKPDRWKSWFYMRDGCERSRDGCALSGNDRPLHP